MCCVPVVTATGYETFFRAEHPKLLALGLALTGDRETARDLAQEALLRAYEHWPRVERLERPGGWARRVLINLATDHHRRATVRRNGVRSDREAMLLPADPAADEWWRAVLALPDRQRAVVALHYLDDLSVGDVAEILGIAQGTVKSTLAKARAALRERLAASEETDDG